MKIAFCLHGNVGMLYTHKRNYKWDQYIDYRIGYTHFKKHIFNINNNVDVFIHSWNTDFEKGIKDIYKPKLSLFEKQKENLDLMEAIKRGKAKGIVTITNALYEKAK